MTMKLVGGGAPLGQHSCWPLTVAFLSLAGHGGLTSHCCHHQLVSHGLMPCDGLVEMPVSSLGPPGLLTSDAALHLQSWRFQLLTLPHPYPSTAMNYNCHRNYCNCNTALGCPHWGAIVPIPSVLAKTGHLPSPIHKKKKGASIPLLIPTFALGILEKMQGAHLSPQHRGLCPLWGRLPALLVGDAGLQWGEGPVLLLMLGGLIPAPDFQGWARRFWDCPKEAQHSFCRGIGQCNCSHL